MNNYDLSILIPARNEMFLAQTVKHILEQIRGNTEVIVVLDGQWTNPPIAADPRVTVVFLPESVGQRAATNIAARISKAKYVMKLDAHCALDEGFDVKMLDAIEDDITLVPVMRNLHGFDWRCLGTVKIAAVPYIESLPENDGCGWSSYQAPTPKDNKCPKCNGTIARLLIWNPKSSPQSTSFCFDTTMHFQYFAKFKDRPEGRPTPENKYMTETLSIQGSCFMLTRDKYWQLNICDEEFGSWGQQGVEVALKTWFSGGRVMCLQNTYYAHLFRTQGGDFGFPYKQSEKQIKHARELSRELFQNGKWTGALPGRNLDWLLKKFYPVPYWHDKKKEEEPIEGGQNIIFYTDNRLNIKIAHKVQRQLKIPQLPIISASLKALPHFGRNITVLGERGIDTYFRQIISALEESKTEIVYMCEHDVLYHPSHFTFIPPRKDMFYYNINFWKIRPGIDNLAVQWEANQVSGLVCYREYLLQWYYAKYEQMKEKGFDRSYEPGGRDKNQYEQFRSAYPNIDIRHKDNLTKSKWSPNDFRDKSTCINWAEITIQQIPGWDKEYLNSLVALQ